MRDLARGEEEKATRETDRSRRKEKQHKPAANERVRQAERGDQKRKARADNTRRCLYFGCGCRQEIGS